jgi:glycosyltransferase involved in cell wall biosynthesis
VAGTAEGRGMTNVVFLYDDGNADGTKGGAELTMEEFASACPPEVAITDLDEAETVVVGNCVSFSPILIKDLEGKKVFRYHHDLARHEHEDLRLWLDQNAQHIFTSPMHCERYRVGWDEANKVAEHHLVPPPVDADRFRPNRQTRRNTERKGVCSIGSWQNPGKGGHLAAETCRRQSLELHVYGPGLFPPAGDHVVHHGDIDPSMVPHILWQYEQFLFLPMSPEPFGRCVVEATYAGCEVLTNENVGAKWWLENEPDKLATAAEDFWKVTLDG